MTDKKIEAVEILLPSLQAHLAIFSMAYPTLSIWGTILTLPLQYLILSSSRAEQQRVAFLLNELTTKLNSMEKDIQYFSSIHGEDLLKKAIAASCQKPGDERISALAQILASYEENEEYYFKATDFLDTLAAINEREWIVLKVSFKLSEGRTLQSILEWKDLHEKFPNLTSREILAIFVSLQRTGLISRQQGFMDDHGDNFEYSPSSFNLFKAF